MAKLPFGPFAYFGYLANGIVTVILIDFVFLGQRLTGTNTNDITGSIILLGLAYAFGQVTASAASWLYERILVRKVIGVPTGFILDLWEPGSIRCGLRFLGILTDYVRPWQGDDPDAIMQVAQARGFPTASPDRLFGCLYRDYLGAGAETEKLETYRNQYHFSRNLSFTLMFWAVFLLAGMTLFGMDPAFSVQVERIENGEKGFGTEDVALGVIIWPCLILGFLLFPRYLKFLRLFQEEVLNWTVAQARKHESPEATADDQPLEKAQEEAAPVPLEAAQSQTVQAQSDAKPDMLEGPQGPPQPSPPRIKPSGP